MNRSSAKARPRIGFFGGMANNCYVAANALRAEGFNVIYIRDRMESYAISQLRWEDYRFKLSYEELKATTKWTPQDWDELTAREGWKAPDWVVDPIDYHETRADQDILSAFVLEHCPNSPPGSRLSL